jgi:pimeloyl-[acyl-carrier protein] methyl ester esterase
MTIHAERHGHGPELVLVHGWGLHGGIWADLAARLAADYCVINLDLPGHGRSPAGEFTLDALTDAIAALLAGPALWLGWSLGGLIAINAALRHPANVSKLVLAGSTPRFVQAADWPHAMAAGVFAEFGASLACDYRGTLLRFLSLQASGDEQARTLLKRLRSDLLAHGEPQPQALAAGLDVLAHTDLRARLAAIRAPTLVMHGALDRLVPPAAGEYLAAQIRGAQFVRFDGAGHAPFLSQPQRFEQTLRGFLA